MTTSVVWDLGIFFLRLDLETSLAESQENKTGLKKIEYFHGECHLLLE